MILYVEMMPLLVEACPSFEPQWLEFQKEWADEPAPPNYIAIAKLARHMSGILAMGDEATLRRVFAILEQLIIEGEPRVSEAAVVGLIEDLQNTNLHDGTKPEQYLPFLLPESKRWWGKVEAYWDKGELLNDD